MNKEQFEQAKTKFSGGGKRRLDLQSILERRTLLLLRRTIRDHRERQFRRRSGANLGRHNLTLQSSVALILVENMESSSGEGKWNSSARKLLTVQAFHQCA